MITPSLETCKKLKEAGWNTPTEMLIFDSVFDDLKGRVTTIKGTIGDVFKDGEGDRMRGGYFYYAPTAEEIMIKLPKNLKKSDGYGGDEYYYFKLWFESEWEKENLNIGKWAVFYEDCYDNTYDEKEPIYNTSLSEALAELWLWCKANGYIAEGE
jgi:hypothetical protein